MKEKKVDLLEFELDPSLFAHCETPTKFSSELLTLSINQYLSALKKTTLLNKDIESNASELLRPESYGFGCKEYKTTEDIRKYLTSKDINTSEEQNFLFSLFSQKRGSSVHKIAHIFGQIYESIKENYTLLNSNRNIHSHGTIEEKIDQNKAAKIHVECDCDCYWHRDPDSERLQSGEKYEFDVLVNLEHKTTHFENAVLSINKQFISQKKIKELEKFKIPTGRYLIQTPEIKKAKLEIDKQFRKIMKFDAQLANKFKQVAYARMSTLPTGSTPDEYKPEVLYYNVVKEIAARKDIKISKQKLLNIFDFSRKPSKWRYVLFGSLILLGAITTIGALLSGFGIIPLVLSTGWLYGLGGGGIIPAAIGIGGTVTTYKNRSTVKQIEPESIEQDTVPTPPDFPLTSTARMISDQGGKQPEPVALLHEVNPATKTNQQEEGPVANPNNKQHADNRLDQQPGSSNKPREFAYNQQI